MQKRSRGLSTMNSRERWGLCGEKTSETRLFRSGAYAAGGVSAKMQAYQAKPFHQKPQDALEESSSFYTVPQRAYASCGAEIL